MDKEKRIEEMYQIFLNYRFSMPAEDFSYKGMVENFIDNNYRKINENEVVISKEEYERLKEGQTISYTAMINSSYLDRIEDLENRLMDKTRKETAEESLKFVDKISKRGVSDE